jgi:hypothetical protein
MTEQPMSGPPKAKASEVTLKITAVKDGYIIRDGKTVAVCREEREVAYTLASFLEDTWADHHLGTPGEDDADQES